MKHNLTVGQKLWYVPARRHEQPQEITITAVGRKWVQCDPWITRLDHETLCADGGQYSSPGRAFLSQAHYQAARDLSAAWSAFTGKIGNAYRVPDGVTIEDISRATELLFGKDPE